MRIAARALESLPKISAGFVLPPLPDAVPAGVSAETPARSVSQRRAGALEHILGRFLAGKSSGSGGGAHELVVHIAHDALRDVPESSGASFENDGPVAVETAQRLAALNAARGLNIDARTARCRWGRERMDYDIAMDALCLQAGYP